MAKATAGASIEIGYKHKIKKPAKKLNLPPDTLTAKQYIGVVKPVEPIKAHRGDQVIWVIINYTNERLKIGVDRFSPNEPINFIDGKSKWVDPDGGVVKIQSVVPKNAPLGHYIYQVFKDGSPALDPELDIET
jgi:hypothetical protein